MTLLKRCFYTDFTAYLTDLFNNGWVHGYSINSSIRFCFELWFTRDHNPFNPVNRLQGLDFLQHLIDAGLEVVGVGECVDSPGHKGMPGTSRTRGFIPATGDVASPDATGQLTTEHFNEETQSESLLTTPLARA